MSVDWTSVAFQLDELAREPSWGGHVTPQEGQRRAVSAIADRIRIGQRALLLADEVGMGKTLIAATLIKAVQRAGGRAAVIIPPGLGSQWVGEFRRLDPADRTLLPLRSFMSFIGAFRRGPGELQERSGSKDRRLQREWPEQAWADERILLLSHNLANIRRTKNTTPWYEGLGRAAEKVLDDTRAYNRMKADAASRAVAEEVISRLRRADQKAFASALRDAGNMDKSWLTMSRGLGQFDLLVVDEAHKARGTTTSLTRVLDLLTWKASGAFRLGMTATPVELDAGQWIDTLRRLAVPEDVLRALENVIKTYVGAVARLQQEEALSQESVGRFRDVSQAFQQQLSPWVLRRDKREDAFLTGFCRAHGSHREVRPAVVGFAGMPLDWKRAFLATEALSMLEEHRLTPSERRLRLSLPDGRGMSALDAVLDVEANVAPETAAQGLWSSLARRALRGGAGAMFSHPAIARTVEEIENAVREGHKVLVFGRFTKPMRALAFLLDAREMVRRLCGEDVVGSRWPQSALGPSDVERDAALEAALNDPAVNTAELDRITLEQRLRERADAYASARRSNLDSMRAALQRRQPEDAVAAALLNLWRTEAHGAASATGAALLLAALEDQRPVEDRHQPWSEDALIKAYVSLVSEVAGGSDDEDAKEAYEERLKDHLEVFGGREGHFARLMNGQTAAQTRRLLQAAFNREGSWPQVLVTQSAVGREGLNLHGACRMVVMLHLEWNPAHVEQQIGRVDRITSRWEREACSFIEDGGGHGVPPRILIRPVVVEGTYDDHHWTVLKQRWESMRAQLNGDVLPGLDENSGDVSRNTLIKEARQAAPSFSPTRLS